MTVMAPVLQVQSAPGAALRSSPVSLGSRHHHHDPARWMLLVPIFQMERLNLRKMEELCLESLWG